MNLLLQGISGPPILGPVTCFPDFMSAQLCKKTVNKERRQQGPAANIGIHGNVCVALWTLAGLPGYRIILYYSIVYHVILEHVIIDYDIL